MQILGFDISRKRKTDERDINRATVAMAEYSRGDTRVPPGIPGLLARATAYNAICADINATNVAAVEFKLYRKARKGRVSRSAMKYLRGERDGSTPGVKASRYARDAGSIEEVDDHPAIDFLGDPNPRDQSFIFWQAQHKRKELCGNAFYSVVLPPGGRVWLRAMFPQHTVIDIAPSGEIRGYWYGRDASHRVMFGLDEVLHEKFAESLFQPWYGSGPMEAVLMETDIYTQARQAESARWQNSARPDAVVLLDKETTKAEVKRIETYLDEKFSGSSRGGKLLVMPGVDLKPLAWSMKDLEYQAGLREMKLTISNAYGVPFTFLDMPSANRASALAGDPFYASNTLLPRVVKHAEWLTEVVLPLFGVNPGEMWFAPEDVVPENEVFELDEKTRLVAGGVRTINEVRASDALDPVEGGDVLRVNGIPLDVLGAKPIGPAQAAPADANGAATPAAPEGGEQTSAGAAREFNGARVTSALETLRGVTDGSLAPEAAVSMLVEFFGIDEGRARSMVDAQVAQREAVVEQQASAAEAEAAAAAAQPKQEPPNPTPEKSAKCCGESVSQKAAYHGAAKAVQDSARVETAAAQAALFLRGQLNTLYENMNAKPQGYRGFARVVPKAAVSGEVERLLRAWGMLDFEAWNKALLESLQPIIRAEFDESASAGASEIAARDPNAKPFSISSEPAREWAKRWTGSMLGGLDGFNRTTAELVGQSIAESLDAGENLDKMQRRIQDAFSASVPSGGSMTDYRAYTIARTESARARGHGKLAGWETTGVVKGKGWFLSADPCQFCEAASARFAGKPIPLDAPFFALGDTLTGIDGGLMVIDFVPVMEASELHPQCRCESQPVIGGSQ